MKHKSIQVGIASYGMSGRVFHGPSFISNPNFKVHSVLERSKNESKIHFPQANIVRSFGNMLSIKEIELIVVNTPDFLHYSMSKQALLAGKHVVVEKPFTQTQAQAEELISIAKSKDLLLSVYQNRRYDNGFLTVKQLLENNILGDVVEFQSNFTRYRNYINEGSWKEEGTDKIGSLYNLGSHMIDQVLCLFGKPLSITAQLEIRRPNGKVVDYFDIRLHYQNFDCVLRSSYLSREPAAQYVVNGTLGSYIKYTPDPQEQQLNQGLFPNQPGYGLEREEDWGILNTELLGLHYRGKVESIRGNYGLYYENIYNVIRNNGVLEVKPEQALETIKILELCIQSNEERRTIDLD